MSLYINITEFDECYIDPLDIFRITVEYGDAPIEITTEAMIASIEEDNEPILENKSYIIKEYVQKLLQQLGEITLTPKQY